MSAEALLSWNEGLAKKAVIDFVATRLRREPVISYPLKNSSSFDNDGTLWSEKPMPIELGFILLRLAAMAEKDDSLRQHLLEGRL